MKLRVKRINENAVLPSKRAGDAGYDLTATDFQITHQYIEYNTGIAVAIPDGYVGLLFPRSSVSKYDLILANCVGVIDSSYRGEVKLRFKALPREGVNFIRYDTGDKIGQLVIVPILEPEIEEVNTLDSTERGEGGFGSTGIKVVGCPLVPKDAVHLIDSSGNEHVINNLAVEEE